VAQIFESTYREVCADIPEKPVASSVARIANRTIKLKILQRFAIRACA